MAAVFQHCDRVFGSYIQRVGNVNLDHIAGVLTGNITGIDDAGISLTQGNLGQYGFDVFLVRDDVLDYAFAKRIPVYGILTGFDQKLEADKSLPEHL